MRTLLRTALLVVVAAAVVAAADAPYVGKWKLNVAKSDFGQMTMTYETVPGGFKMSMDGLSYTIKTDGKEYASPWGTMETLKVVDANTWEGSSKANGKLTATSTIKLSADGKTVTVTSKTMKVSGEASNDTMTLTRVSGGPGLAGTWKAAKMTSTSPGVVELSSAGADSLKIAFVDQNAVCDAKFDGKDHPASGPMWPSGWTCVVAKNGANAFDVAWKKDGKAMYKSTFTASADGKTLTESGGAVATTEKVKVVYDRQ